MSRLIELPKEIKHFKLDTDYLYVTGESYFMYLTTRVMRCILVLSEILGKEESSVLTKEESLEG